MREREGHMEEQSDTTRGSWLWNKLWRIPIIPRIKVFFWQMCNDALPTRFNLNHRIGGMEIHCPLCNWGIETGIHAFRDCGWIKEVWEEVGVETDDDEGTRDMREWVEWVMRRLSEEECMMFMVGCWALWEGRNKNPFEGVMWSAGAVIKRVVELQWEVQQSNGTTVELKTDSRGLRSEASDQQQC